MWAFFLFLSLLQLPCMAFVVPPARQHLSVPASKSSTKSLLDIDNVQQPIPDAMPKPLMGETQHIVKEVPQRGRAWAAVHGFLTFIDGMFLSDEDIAILLFDEEMKKE